MNNLLNEVLKVQTGSTAANAAVLLTRLGIGALMLPHGIAKVKKLFSPGPIQFFSTFGLSEKKSLILAAAIEIFFSVCLLLGFGTRLAAFALAGTMMVAAFYTLRAAPFAKKELPLLYLLVYASLVLAGSGEYSLDFLLFGPAH